MAEYSYGMDVVDERKGLGDTNVEGEDIGVGKSEYADVA